MDIAMPPSFPMDEFRAFGLTASSFFPKVHSDEDLNDPLYRRTGFDWAWQAVRYRYRSCAECAEEFKALLARPSESWVAGWGDEELTYRLERCIYMFFMGGLSIFESFGFCLYFLGGALQPGKFPHIATPQKITLAATSKAFTVACPNAGITGELAALLKTPEFTQIDNIRNLLAHRLSGRHSVQESVTLHPDGTYTVDMHEETWHIPGLNQGLEFGDDMLQRHLRDITGMLAKLTTAAREFADNQQAASANP